MRSKINKITITEDETSKEGQSRSHKGGVVER